MFPIKDYQYTLPDRGHPGSFGAVRRHDIHTGVDLYCNLGDNVHAIETGTVVGIQHFTGEWADSSWWNNTDAVFVSGKSGIIVYGEIDPVEGLKVGDTVLEGAILGQVLTVLKKDKGKPMTMLHIELYSHHYEPQAVWWDLNQPQPKYLQDITPILERERMREALE